MKTAIVLMSTFAIGLAFYNIGFECGRAAGIHWATEQVYPSHTSSR